MCAVVPRKWSEGRQKGPEIDKLSSPLFPRPDDHVASSIQNITNLEEHCCAYMPTLQNIAFEIFGPIGDSICFCFFPEQKRDKQEDV